MQAQPAISIVQIAPSVLPQVSELKTEDTPKGRYLIAMGAALALSLEATRVARAAIDMATADWEGSADCCESFAGDVANTGLRLTNAGSMAGLCAS